MNTPPPALCPKCGAPLPADAPEGLCPRCLASASLLGETVLPNEEAPRHAPVSIDEIAPHFPQLEILECLGRGGMGIVYKARQKTLNRFVALKLLAPERIHDAAFAERFAREAQALAALSHPGIVTIHDFGQAGRYFYLLMEFVDGVNLRQAMNGGRFTPEEALAIVPPVCEALQFAHEHGIVHRDIKPENLLLDKAGKVKIADFGIAKMLNVEGSEVGVAETQPGGTPQYMAPEQKGRRRTDHRADIYSLGVVLYELLTGELPAEKLQPPSRKVQIDVRLDGIVLRALEKTPELRYQTAGEFRTEVETVRNTEAPPAPPDLAASVATPSRFSRMAIWGALWPLALPGGLALHGLVTAFPPASPLRWMVGLPAFVLIILGQLAFPGMPLLGWIAVSRIRHSQGRLHGLGLAVFDGLLFPLLALDAFICWLWVIVFKLTMSPQVWEPNILPNLIWEWTLVAGAITALIADFLIIRRVWRAVNEPAVTPSGPVPLASPGGTRLPSPPSAEPAEFARPADARFSRMAVAGACWAPLFFIFVLLFFWTSPAPQGREHLGPTAVQTILAFTLLPLGLLAPFGTTILGWVSVSQIQRSRGLLYGLGLAVADGLLFPLVALTSLVGWFLWWLWRGTFGQEGIPTYRPDMPWWRALTRVINLHSTAFLILGTLLIGGLLSLFIAKRVWWSVLAKDAGPSLPATRASLDPPRAYFALAVAGLAALLGISELMELPYASSALAFSSMAIALAGLLLAWPVRALSLGKAALGATCATIGLWMLIIPGGMIWESLRRGETVAGSSESATTENGRDVQRPGKPPYYAQLAQGSVSVRGLTPHPRSNGAGWLPDGSQAVEQFPELGGYSSAEGKLMRELVILVHGQAGAPSEPIVRFAPGSGFGAMGSVSRRETHPITLTHVVAIACPPDALDTNIEIGVAEGEWQIVHQLRKPTPDARIYSRQTSDAVGLWEAEVKLTVVPGTGEIALAWHYSVSTTHETRLVAVKGDGSVFALSGDEVKTAGGLRQGIHSMPPRDYATIEEFQYQIRPYQWTEFRHVSLRFGHQTTVETVSAPKGGPAPTAVSSPPKPAVETEATRARMQLEKSLLHELEVHLTRRNTKEEPGEEITYRGLMVDLAHNLLTAEITVDQPKPQSSSPHHAGWSRVPVARLAASQDRPGEWTVTAKTAELSPLNFLVRTPYDIPPGLVSRPAGAAKIGDTIEREMTAPAHERKAIAEGAVPKARAEVQATRWNGDPASLEATQRSQNRVRIMEAHLWGDAVKCAEMELYAARQEVLTATKKFESDLISKAELERLKSAEAAAAGRLRDVQANPEERCGIKLETGELVALPAGFALKANHDSPEQEKALEWMRRHQVDAVVSFARYGPPEGGDAVISMAPGGSLERGGLLGADMISIQASDQDWEITDAATLERRIEETLPGSSFTPRVLEFFSSGRLPATFLFKTRTGAMGVFQITGLDTVAHRITFRYRIVKAAPKVAEAVAPAPAAADKKNAAAAYVPPPKISLLDIERHTRGSIDAWDADGKALSNKIRWIVKPDVFLNDEGEAREDRTHYLVSLLVENPPPDEITHGDWSASFGDGTGSVTLPTYRPSDGLPGSLYRITAEVRPEQKRVSVRFGIPIKDWAPVLILQGPVWKAVEKRAPFDEAESAVDLGSRVSLTAAVLPAGSRLGLGADVPMTKLKLKLPAGVQYDWDWHAVLVDKNGKEYQPDTRRGGAIIPGTDLLFEPFDSNLLVVDYYVADPLSIVKIIVNGRSHERDYHWAQFKDLPLTGLQAEKKPEPAVAKAVDPVEAVELKVARTQLEKALGDIQQTQFDLQTPPAPSQTPAQLEAATARLRQRLSALEDQAAKLRTYLREKTPTP